MEFDREAVALGEPPISLEAGVVMREAVFQFHGELNDFLPTNRRECPFSHRFLLPSSVKDMIEALGVPHTEVDIILVNDGLVDFGYLVQDGDIISVYPVSALQYTFCRSVAAATAGISFCSGHPSRSAGGVPQDVGLRYPVTRNPHALWVVQRLRETWVNQQPHRFLLFARDAKFDADVLSAVRDMGSEPTRTAFGCPWQTRCC